MRTKNEIFRTVVALIAVLLAASNVGAANLTGTVRSAAGDTVTDARVTVVELERSTFTSDDGTYELRDLPPGSYHVSASSRRYGTAVREFVLDGDASIDLILGVSSHEESIVVSAGTTRGIWEVYKPVEVLDETELSRKLQPTLGETLAGESGVRATSFAPGASRPVIRGQGGGRVRILEGGLDVGDASSTSPDHAVSVDPVSAESIEILRGPATLLYGSSAVGGAVNVLDRRVPEYVPRKSIGGAVGLRFGSVADDRSGNLVLDGGSGSFAWHVDASRREADDYDIPGRAVEGDPDSPDGTLVNSALESQTLTVGGSWVGSRGFVGASVRQFDTKYGIPAELEEEEDPAPSVLDGAPLFLPAIGDNGVAIDLEQRRYDVRGGFNGRFGPFRGVRVSAGRTDYEHVELEEGQVGTRFFNESTDLRIELPHGSADRPSGVVGLQAGRRDFEAIGAEAFVPPSVTDTWALFVLEEIERGDLSYELGVRYENQEIEAEGNPSRDFDGLSASAGMVWRIGDGWSVGGSLSQAVRLPSAEELFSDGPHLATLSFELGDPDLVEETSLGIDLNVRKRTGRLTGEIAVFWNDFDDYIFEVATGAIEDGLPVFQFTQGDAEFYGIEVEGVISLFHADRHDFDLELSHDRVRATLKSTDRPLPRIPAERYGAALHYRGVRWYGSVGAAWTDDQDRIAPTETATDGYTLVDASIGYRFAKSGLVHDLMLRGTNLTDEEARPHTSRLKQFVPLAGRDLSVVYRLLF